jgi:hypothetical protein
MPHQIILSAIKWNASYHLVVIYSDTLQETNSLFGCNNNELHFIHQGGPKF